MFSLSSKFVFSSTTPISALVAKFAYLSLATKYSVVNLLNSCLVTYITSINILIALTFLTNLSYTYFWTILFFINTLSLLKATQGHKEMHHLGGTHFTILWDWHFSSK